MDGLLTDPCTCFPSFDDGFLSFAIVHLLGYFFGGITIDGLSAERSSLEA
jgi:hypothetical protein